MKFPRDAGPLADARVECPIELPRQLRDAPLIRRPQQRGEAERHHRLKPTGLVKRRRNREFQRGAGLVPHAVVVARDHAEAIKARTQIRILHLPVVDDLLPVGVLSFEQVTEAHLLGRDQAQRRVIDREISGARWQPQPVRRVVDLVVGSDVLDVHRWRKFVERQMMRIDHADAGITHEQQLAIRGFCDNRVVAAGEPMTAHSVGTVENGRMDRLLWIGGPGVQLGAANTQQATGEIQPDRLRVVLPHPVNRIAGQSIFSGERQNAAVFDSAQTALSCSPEDPIPIDVEIADHSLAQPLGACVRGAELAVLEISYATVYKIQAINHLAQHHAGERKPVPCARA